MKRHLKNPGVWLIVFLVLYYGVLPIALLIADNAEERVVMMDGQSRTVFIEWDTSRIRMPVGFVTSVLVEERGRVQRMTYFPPSRFITGIIRVRHEPTADELGLYRALFHSGG